MGKKNNRIGVLIFSGDDFVREGIVDALSGEADIRIKGHASSVFELEGQIKKLSPDVVIVNDHNKGISSSEAISLVDKKNNNRTKILLLINDYDEDRELDALKMGVRGFLPKGVAKADLVRCIKAINTGEMWVRRRVMQKLIDQFLNRSMAYDPDR